MSVKDLKLLIPFTLQEPYHICVAGVRPRHSLIDLCLSVFFSCQAPAMACRLVASYPPPLPSRAAQPLDPTALSCAVLLLAPAAMAGAPRGARPAGRSCDYAPRLEWGAATLGSGGRRSGYQAATPAAGPTGSGAATSISWCGGDRATAPQG
jgi:hypothetical protein